MLPQEARDWGLRNGIPLPPSGAAVRVTDKTDALRLLAPDPYTIFQISPILPAATQRLRLTVGAPAGTRIGDVCAGWAVDWHGGGVALGGVVDSRAGRSRTGGAGCDGGWIDADERGCAVHRDELRAAAES